MACCKKALLLVHIVPTFPSPLKQKLMIASLTGWFCSSQKLFNQKDNAKRNYKKRLIEYCGAAIINQFWKGIYEA